ncbi:type II secretion system F family protein [Vibrio sp. PP-XX7]
MLLFHLTHQITNGVSVTTAFKHATSHFQGIYTDLIHAGEISGQINDAFEQLTQYRERKEHLHAKLLKATIYPCIVICSAMLLTFIMLTRVIPQFEMMFHQFGAELPWFTCQVLRLSHLMKDKGRMIFIFCIILIGLMKMANKHFIPCQHLTERLQLGLPVLGPLLIQSALIRCCRTLASCYHCGIPILECLQHAKNTIGLLQYESALERATEQVSSGVTLYNAIRNTKCFPEFMVQMIMVGEESDTLDSMLKKVASHYEQRVDQMVDQLGQLMEPLIILLLGIIVGGPHNRNVFTSL